MTVYREPGRALTEAEADEMRRPLTEPAVVLPYGRPDMMEEILRFIAARVLRDWEKLVPRATGRFTSVQRDGSIRVVVGRPDGERMVIDLDPTIAHLPPSFAWNEFERLYETGEWQEGVAW